MKNKYPEKLELMLDLSLFFQVKAPDLIQEDEGKTYTLPRKRRATNCKEDFNEIFEREFSVSSSNDEEYFKNDLIELIQDKLKAYKAEIKGDPTNKRSYPLIEITYKFIEYLKESDKPEIKDNTAPEDNLIVKGLKPLSGNSTRNHKPIMSDDDFEKLTCWVTNYFENDLCIPEIKTPVKNVNIQQIVLVNTFTKLYRELYPSATMPDSLFELIKKSFHKYREKSIENLRKANRE